MGIYDRDYARQDAPGYFLGSHRSAVTNILLITAAVFVAQILFDKPHGPQPVTKTLALQPDLFSAGLLTHPWRIFELVTYGFVHSRDNIMHIAANLFMFWLFGRDIEGLYGKRRFVWMFLTALIVAGLGWLAISVLRHGNNPGPGLIGNSGGVMAVALLFVLHYPRRTLLIWGILPVPAWVLGVLWLAGDLSGALGDRGNVAYEAHLSGAAYAWLFYTTNWSLLNLLPRNFSLGLDRLRRLKPRPKLKRYDPDAEERAISSQVDDILRKIHEQGQESLTPKEQRILRDASRRYQQKNQ